MINYFGFFLCKLILLKVSNNSVRFFWTFSTVLTVILLFSGVSNFRSRLWHGTIKFLISYVISSFGDFLILSDFAPKPNTDSRFRKSRTLSLPLGISSFSPTSLRNQIRTHVFANLVRYLFLWGFPHSLRLRSETKYGLTFSQISYVISSFGDFLIFSDFAPKPNTDSRFRKSRTLSLLLGISSFSPTSLRNQIRTHVFANLVRYLFFWGFPHSLRLRSETKYGLTFSQISYVISSFGDFLIFSDFAPKPNTDSRFCKSRTLSLLLGISSFSPTSLRNQIRTHVFANLVRYLYVFSMFSFSDFLLTLWC